MSRINETGLFVRIALLSTLLIGGIIGLTSLIAPFTGLPIDAGHRLQHIHLQIWYFIGGFVLGAGFRIIPQLSGHPLAMDWLPGFGSLLYTGTAFLWVFALPFLFPRAGGYHWILILAAGAELVVWAIFCGMLLNSLIFASREGVWKPVAGIALGMILVCSGVSAAGWTGLAGSGSYGIEWIRFGYKGFLFVGVPMLAMGISGRAIRKREDPDWAYLLGVLLITLSMVSFAQLFEVYWLDWVAVYSFLPGFALFAYGISFHKQYDRLNIPGFYHGVVVAFSFVLIFAVLYLLYQTMTVNLLYRGLIHVWALGFLTVLIVAYGTWIFPAAAGKTPINSPSTVVSIYSLALGTLLRVVAPMIVQWTGASGDTYSILLFGGGLLQYTGIAIFTVALWPNLPPIVEGSD